MEEKKTFNPLIPVIGVLLVILLALSVICFRLWSDKGKAIQQAKEYKTSYDDLLVESDKVKQEAEEYKTAYTSLLEEIEKTKQDADAYQASYNELVYSMLDGGCLAEDIGNFTVKVWQNAIFKENDEETDKFTKVNGKFVSDFNDALGNLFQDAGYSADTDKLYKNQLQARTSMKNMLDPPEGYENAYKALESLYSAYIELTDGVLRCRGSLNSFSEDFSNTDKEFGQKFRAAELYVKNNNVKK